MIIAIGAYNPVMRRAVFAAFGVCLLVFGGPITGRAAQQPPPVPQPFPRAGGSSQQAEPAPQQPAPATQPTTDGAGQQAQPSQPAAGQPNPAAASPEAELAAKLGLPIYPAAQFLGSYDAGRGQRYCLFGSSVPFNDLVTYYKAVLKQRGNMVFDSPGTYMFEVGKFDEDTMAFPPGVTIKDFQSQLSSGYPNPKPGGQPAFFPSIIQIVPAPTPQTQR